MKTFLLTTIAFLAFSITCKAQWTPGTGTITTTNSVGIGITLPENKLHIVDAAGTNNINLQTSTNVLNETIGLAFGTQPGDRTKAAIVGVNTNAGNAGGALAFYTNAGSSLNENMRITSSGNVGIGITGPGSTLHLYENNTGNNAAVGLTVEQGGTGNSLLQFLQTGVQRWTMGIDNANSRSFKIATGQGLGTADKFTILTSGNIGIGTTAPENKLHIVDAAGTNNINIQSATNVLNETVGISFGTQPGDRTKAAITSVNTNAGNGQGALAFYTNTGSSLSEAMRISAAGNVGINTIAPASTLHVYNNNTENGIYTGLTVEQAGTGNSLLQFLQTGTQRWTMGIDNANSQAFKIATGTGVGLGTADKFTVLTSGNVGIGTANPDAKLAVKGTIHSTSVLVDANVPTPDYVFKADYRLPTLAEVKAYTDKNHHLSDVPAAAEFEKNGINLGEMNMVLLKKVEELTLYLMEQDKKEKESLELIKKQQTELNVQKSDNQASEERIKKLEKQLDALTRKVETNQ